MSNRPTTRREAKNRARRTVRVVASVASIALLPLSVWAALVVPQASGAIVPAAVVVQPADELREPICAGPVRDQRQANAADAGSAIGRATVTAVTTGTQGLTLSTLTGDTVRTADPGRTLASTTIGYLADGVVARSSGSAATVGATQWQALATGTRIGYVATGCASPSSDTWIVGGETTTGRTLTLRLLNSSSSDAVVTVTPYTESGEQKSEQVTVPATGELSVRMAALVPDATSVAVHLVSTGATVSAYLQQISVDAITAAGVDLWGAGDQPSTSVRIPGVRVAGATATARVVSETDTTATVTAVSASGGSGMTTQVTLSAGVVTDVPLTGLAQGTYTVLVESQANVSASARVSSSGDFGWVASAPLSSSATFAVPQTASSANSELTIYSTDDGTATLTSAEGTTKEIDVTGGVPVAVAVSAGAYTLTGAATFAAAVSVSGPRAAAGYPVTPQSSSTAAVTVFPQ